MGTKRKKTTQSIYLEYDKTALLDELSAETRIPKAALMREAIDDLLVKHKKLRAPRKVKL
jgi:predicted DNA-binding protein